MKKAENSSFSGEVQILAEKAADDKQAFSDLICRYTPMIQASVVSKAETPDEVKDLTQEGLMGLFEAVKTYDAEKGVRFATYAGVCIKNKIMSALRSRSRSAVAIDGDGEQLTSAVKDETYDADPEKVAIDRVSVGELMGTAVEVLSKRELEIFERYLGGSSYEVIADELCLPLKSVDNAMQRVRRKLRSVLGGDADTVEQD